jgi:hypothetical protein
MHEFAKTIVAEFEPVTLVNLHALAERDHPMWVLTEANRFRIWAGVLGRGDSRRPSIELLEALFARGKPSLVALYRAFEATVTSAESVMVLRALGALARAAEAQKVIAWNIDNVKPDDGRGRLLVSFDPALDERLRAAAKSEGQNLSDFVRLAVSDRIAAIEKRRPRERAATATA